MKLTPSAVDRRAATPEGLRALDVIVAKNFGWYLWRKGRTGPIKWVRRGSAEFRLKSNGPPPYVSSAPDAPDRWRWWGEVIEMLDAHGHGDLAQDAFTSWHRERLANPRGFITLVALGPYLAKALAAAGLLEKGDTE